MEEKHVDPWLYILHDGCGHRTHPWGYNKANSFLGAKTFFSYVDINIWSIAFAAANTYIRLFM